MNSMIRNGIAWSDGNTCTTYDQKGNCEVYLHGNHIATVGKGFMAIFDGGYQSNTTKSRLNALLQEFRPHTRVFQKDWDWFVSYNDQTTLFRDGMILLDADSLITA